MNIDPPSYWYAVMIYYELVPAWYFWYAFGDALKGSIRWAQLFTQLTIDSRHTYIHTYNVRIESYNHIGMKYISYIHAHAYAQFSHLINRCSVLTEHHATSVTVVQHQRPVNGETYTWTGTKRWIKPSNRRDPVQESLSDSHCKTAERTTHPEKSLGFAGLLPTSGRDAADWISVEGLIRRLGGPTPIRFFCGRMPHRLVPVHSPSPPSQRLLAYGWNVSNIIPWKKNGNIWQLLLGLTSRLFVEGCLDEWQANIEGTLVQSLPLMLNTSSKAFKLNKFQMY